MNTPIGRASLLFCLLASPLWAGPVGTEVNTGRTTSGTRTPTASMDVASAPSFFRSVRNAGCGRFS